ncbi:MAG: hypothetical protein C4523_04780 [Myxococcales bacterium]|nr:MAG: hypothetical protein C4523_04780 [Myxococcales bacterium]
MHKQGKNPLLLLEYAMGRRSFKWFWPIIAGIAFLTACAGADSTEDGDNADGDAVADQPSDGDEQTDDDTDGDLVDNDPAEDGDEGEIDIDPDGDLDEDPDGDPVEDGDETDTDGDEPVDGDAEPAPSWTSLSRELAQYVRQYALVRVGIAPAELGLPEATAAALIAGEPTVSSQQVVIDGEGYRAVTIDGEATVEMVSYGDGVEPPARARGWPPDPAPTACPSRIAGGWELGGVEFYAPSAFSGDVFLAPDVIQGFPGNEVDPYEAPVPQLDAASGVLPRNGVDGLAREFCAADPPDLSEEQINQAASSGRLEVANIHLSALSLAPQGEAPAVHFLFVKAKRKYLGGGPAPAWDGRMEFGLHVQAGNFAFSFTHLWDDETPCRECGEEGPCCDGCRLAGPTVECVDPSETEFFCSTSTCGTTRYTQEVRRFCPEDSAACARGEWTPEQPEPTYLDPCGPEETCELISGDCVQDSNCCTECRSVTACCDGCHFRPPATVCMTDVLGAEQYRCVGACGGVVQRRAADLLCPGDNAQCVGDNFVYQDWTAFASCDGTQRCTAAGDGSSADCQLDPSCGTNSPPMLAAIGPQTLGQGESRDVNLSAADADGGQTLTFCKAGGPAWATVSGSGASPGPVLGALALNPGPDVVGAFSVIVRVFDGGGCDDPEGVDEESVTVTITAANRPPVLAAIGAQTLGQGESRNVSLSAADPDAGQTLTFCKQSGPAWATVSGFGASPGPVGGTLALNPGSDIFGDFTVVVRAIDGGSCGAPQAYDEESVSISIQQGNRPPVLSAIGVQSFGQGESRNVNLSATDPDAGQTLTFCKQSGPAWAAVSGSGASPGPAGGTLALNPGADVAGEFAVVVRVIDGGSCGAPQSYDEESVSIFITQGNHPPDLSPIGAQSMGAGESKNAPLSASDPDSGQFLNFCKQSGPTWATVSGSGMSPGPASGTLALNPGPEVAGQFTVVVRVIDGGNCGAPQAYDEESVSVSVAQGNVSPTLAAIGAQSVTRGTTKEVALSATDPDAGQTLAFCKINGPAWATVSGSGPSPATGTLTLSPDTSVNGNYDVLIRVIDGGTCNAPGGYDEEPIVVSVTVPANTPPTLAAIGPQTATPGESKAVPLQASDPDTTQFLNFCKTEGPEWATVTGFGPASAPVAGSLNLNPPLTATGSAQVTVRVYDGGACNAPESYDDETVTVTLQSNNHAPDLAAIASQTLAPGDVRQIQLSATDSDSGQTLTFCKTSGPDWAIVFGSGPSPGTATGTLSIFPGAEVSGAFTIGVRVYDGGSCQIPAGHDDQDVQVTVQAGANHLPELYLIADQTVYVGETKTVNITASDQDTSQTLTFCKMSGPAFASVSGSGSAATPVLGSLTLTPTIANVGNHTVVVRVIDGGTCNSPLAYDEQSVAVAVRNDNTPPDMDPVGNQTVARGGMKTVTLRASDAQTGQLLAFCVVPGPSTPSWAHAMGGGLSAGPGVKVEGQLSLTPPGEGEGAVAPGNYSVTIRVYDGGSCEAPLAKEDEPITVTVTAR